MTKNITTKTVAAATTAAPVGSLMDMLAGAVKAQATGFKATEASLRAKAREVVGTDVDVLTLQTMVSEAEALGLPAEFLSGFKAKAKEGRDLLIQAETAGQMARRLQAASTPEGLQAQLERAKAQNAAKAEQEKRAKAQEANRKAQEAQEARISGILAQMGELTHGQAHSVACFLRENPTWVFKANEKGVAALKAAAFEVAARRKAWLKAQAEGRRTQEEAQAPLRHKMDVKK